MLPGTLDRENIANDVDEVLCPDRNKRLFIACQTDATLNLTERHCAKEDEVVFRHSCTVYSKVDPFIKLSSQFEEKGARRKSAGLHTNSVFQHYNQIPFISPNNHLGINPTDGLGPAVENKLRHYFLVLSISILNMCKGGSFQRTFPLDIRINTPKSVFVRGRKLMFAS
ncbi:Hypothetical predicted protein [Scomber scombrus]|uniref:Uncharacterized protein n=1 Tax=Scomber scombrus TaxID=13677 RepID=A0AAV1P516_SCOSC